VYALSEKGEELLLEEVAAVEVEGEQVVMRPLFGEPLSLAARLVEIDLMKHRIVLERR
jgi:predicted RNA-binding protein